MKKKLAGLLMLSMCMGVFAGCGSAENQGTDAAGDTTASNNAGGAVSVSVEEIKERGTLIIGGEMNYKPYEYLDENDEYTGYDIEIWNYIAEDLGVELEIVDLPFSGALTGLDAGKYDVVGCVVGVNAERAKAYEFSVPVIQTSYYAVKAAANEAITSMDDLAGCSVGAQTGSTAEVRVQAFAEEMEEKGTPVGDVKLYSGTTDAFMDVLSGGIDAACEAADMVNTLMENQPGQYEILGEVGDPSYLSYAFRLSDTEWKDYVNAEIKKMKEDGTLGELMTKYFGYDLTEELPESGFIPE